MPEITLSQLVASRNAAKDLEDQAVAARRKIDADIAAHMKDANKLEGSISEKIDDCKVTVTFKIDRKVDAEKLITAWPELPAGVMRAFNWKPEVLVSELRSLEGADSLQALQFITSKPATPAVKIERL